MPTLTMTRGLPGSGKSYWADAYVLQRQAGSVVRINKDTLREMLHAGRWKGSKTERHVVAARDDLVALFLARSTDVVVDDTNLDPKHEVRLRELAAAHDAGFVIQDFTDVALDLCIRRDLSRARSVGERVIKQMHARYLAPAVEDYICPDGAPAAVIVDIDGTVADMTGLRGPFEWAKVSVDRPVRAVIELVRDLSAGGVKIIFVTGRDGSCRAETEAWLLEHVNVPIELLIMKDPGDRRSDAITKREHFDRYIRGQYRVRFCLDDRDRAVALYRSLGLTVLQVADGNF